MPSLAIATYIDHSGEKSRVSFNLAELTGANFADTINDVGTNATTGATLIEAISTLSLMTFAGISFTRSYKVDNARPANKNAQRERKWVVVYEDTTAELAAGVPNPGAGKIFTFEIPGANLNDDTLQLNGDYANLGFAGWQDFVDRFEAEAKSPYGGTPNVIEAYAVGRNL